MVASLEIILKLYLELFRTNFKLNFKFNFEGEARPKDRIQGGVGKQH